MFLNREVSLFVFIKKTLDYAAFVEKICFT
jgi:hypothetical protein